MPEMREMGAMKLATVGRQIDRMRLNQPNEDAERVAQGRDAALSRQVACTDGLCSSAPKKGDE